MLGCKLMDLDVRANVWREWSLSVRAKDVDVGRVIVEYAFGRAGLWVSV